MTDLHLSLVPPIGGLTGAAATLRRVADADGRSAPIVSRSVTIPSDGLKVKVDPGVYVVEACLTSGEIVSDQVVVGLDMAAELSLATVVTKNVSARKPTTWQLDEDVAAIAGTFDHPSAGGMFRTAGVGNADMPDHTLIELVVIKAGGSRRDWDVVLQADSPRWRHLDEKHHAIVRTPDHHFKVSRPRRLRQRCWSHVCVAGDSRVVSLPFEPVEKSPIRTVEIVVDAEQGAFRLLDEHVGALLDYLSSESYGAAAITLDAISDRIRSSHSGDFKALAHEQLNGAIGLCAAAYAASASRHVGAWLETIEDLASREWLPDGAVLAGHRLLFEVNTEESWAQAGEWFRTSLNRGVPYFSLGLDFLVDGLTVLAGRDASYEEDLRQVSSVARRARRGEAFTTLSAARA